LKRLSLAIYVAVATLLAGCTTGGVSYGISYSGGDYYGAGYGYGAGCDYYAPPWGYPNDYCSYSLWYDPIYFGGAWYSGPVYYRHYAGANWYWLHGGWRRDQWRGSRPRIDWNDRRNHRWQGDMRRGDGDRNWRGRDRGPDVANVPPGNGPQNPNNGPGGRNWNRGGDNGAQNSNEGPRGGFGGPNRDGDTGPRRGFGGRNPEGDSGPRAGGFPGGGAQRAAAPPPPPRVERSAPAPRQSNWGGGNRPERAAGGPSERGSDGFGRRRSRE
jgi:hypothetical protein